MNKNFIIDEDTNLFLNNPSTWSVSPYLGAQWSEQSKKYYASFRIPQEIFMNLIHNHHSRWASYLPEYYLEENSLKRASIRMGSFSDPRQAAWVVQQVLYSDEYDTEEMIEDFLEMKYKDGSGDIISEILENIPEFKGDFLTVEDAKHKFPTEEVKKILTQQKNFIEFSNRMARFVKNSIETLNKGYDSNYFIEKFGYEFFLKSPSSPKLREDFNCVVERLAA